MSEFRKVNQPEFDAWIAAYPRPLRRNVINMGVPPVIQFEDHSLGGWPACVVASYLAFGGDPNDIWAEVPTGWRIRPDALIEEVTSDTR